LTGAVRNFVHLIGELAVVSMYLCNLDVQMQRMSPDELARIQQMAASMDPSVMASAARSMQSLRPEEVRMASEQVGSHCKP
jgi:hypothetical protein